MNDLIKAIEGLICDSSTGNPIEQGRRLAYNEGVRDALALAKLGTIRVVI
jgi:hypothetical protein